jgi:hypothetical protein
MPRFLLVFLLGIAAVSCRAQRPDDAPVPTGFAATIQALSEPGGFFDTDNLISNERSYLHAIESLEALAGRDLAYVGVGPGQNFSYIAAMRPSVAYVVDIRRDNVLLHLLYKALFELAPSRVEFMALWFGRSAPSNAADWSDVPVETLLAFVDSALPGPAAEIRAVVDSAIASFGVPLSDDDWTTIRRFHRTFRDDGPSLRFVTFGRAPRPHYPTLRDLMLERDRSGRQAHYLTSADRYQVVRQLQISDRVIPVVGDLAGPHAVQAIGRHARDGGRRVGAVYVSNVEFYLFRQQSFGAYVRNLGALPHDERSIVVRSVFDRGGFGRDGVVYYSRQLATLLPDMLQAHAAGLVPSYRALVELSPVGASR